MSLWCCFGSAGRPNSQEAKCIEKDAPKDDGGSPPPALATGAMGSAATQVHGSRPATLSSTPQIKVQVYNVEQLARLHPRVLERMPHLLTLTSPGSPGASCDARSAVACYWQLQEAVESAKKVSEGEALPLTGPLLFLQPLAINSAAGALLGCAPSLSECARMLAQQLLFQSRAPLQQSTFTATPEPSGSLAAVLFEVAAHTLRCTPSIPAAEPSARNPVCITNSSDSHAAVDHCPKQAQCGDGLIAHVHAAYCTAPGGSLDPVLILEHAVAEGTLTSLQRKDSWLAPPSGFCRTSMAESVESPGMLRESCMDASLHHYVPSPPHPIDGAHLTRMPLATSRTGSSPSTTTSSTSNAFSQKHSSLGTTRPWLLAETGNSCQLQIGQFQAERATRAWSGFSAPESCPDNHQQPVQVQNVCPPVQFPKVQSLFEGTSMQKQHSRALAILNEVPVIATLFNVEGNVVYQNEASLSYWGLLLGVKQQKLNGGALDRGSVESGTCNLSALLEALLPNSPEAIQEVLDIVGEGLQWQRVLAVRPPKARSQAQGSITPAVSSQRSKRASISSNNGAGSTGKDRDGCCCSGGKDHGNSCRPSADALGGSSAKEPPDQLGSATPQPWLQNVQLQPKRQLHRQQTQPQPVKQPQERGLLRRGVSFATDHFPPGGEQQEEHTQQQDTARGGDFLCQASRNGDLLLNSNPDPEIHAQGLVRAPTDPAPRISKNGLPCHSDIGRDPLQDEPGSLKHMSLSSSQHVGEDVQDCPPTNTSLPVPPATPAQARSSRPIVTADPANSSLSSQELDETSGLPSLTKLSCPSGTPRSRSNFLLSSDGSQHPRGSQHLGEATSGTSNVVAASRTKRSGLAVEPSSRVMSLIQGTTSAHDSINGEGALNRKSMQGKRKKDEPRPARNKTISNFHTLDPAAKFSNNGNEACKDNSTALLGADLISRSVPALDISQVHDPASAQLSTLLSDDGPSSQQHPQRQHNGLHSSQGKQENHSDESSLLPILPSLNSGVPGDLEVPAIQTLLGLPCAHSPQPSGTKRKHTFKRRQSSPLLDTDIISGLDSKAHPSSERRKSIGCGSPCAANWEGLNLTKNSTYESLDCHGNPEGTSAAASVAESYQTAGDSPDMSFCGAMLEHGDQQQSVPVLEGQQCHELERQGQHNLPHQRSPHHRQQQQQPHQLQLLTSSSKDEHSFCHLAAEGSIEDGQQELYSSGVPSTELCWHEVLAMAITDPVTGHAALLLLQTDITSRALLESRMATLTESQLAMLEQMFPRHVLEYMVTKQPGQQPAQAGTASHLASSHENVTILFTDIVGFTGMSKEVKPDQVMAYLNELFTAFDALVDMYEIFKVETAGDCYIAAGGLTKIDQDGFICIDHEPDPVEAAHRVLSFAKALLYCAKTVMMPHNGQPTRIRVGMHTGPAVTGLIGTKLPKYSVFGDTMNTASRMESTCPYGCIQISDSTHALLTDHPFKPTGGVEVKGKGRMETFIWDPEEEPNYTIPPDVVFAVMCAKEAVKVEEEDASGYSLSSSLPLQGKFEERAQRYDMRYACAEDWSNMRRRSTGAASSTLSFKGALRELEALQDLQQHGPQQEQTHAQQVRLQSAPSMYNRHPLTALHHLQSCFPMASPLSPGPMSQGPPCPPGQDPGWPRPMQHGESVLQPAGSSSRRSSGGSKYTSFDISKGEVPPGAGTTPTPSNDSTYSQLRQSLGDLAKGHHPLGSSRVSGSSSPFAKTSLTTTRSRSQQQVDLGLGLGQQVLRRASDQLGLGQLFQLPPGPQLSGGDAHAQQAGVPRVQHSSCGSRSAAPATLTAPLRLHSWAHSVVVGVPQQAIPTELTNNGSTSPSSAGVAHKAEAQRPSLEAAAASSMMSNASLLKHPDTPTATLQAHVKSPAALPPSNLLGGLDHSVIMPATAPRPPRRLATISTPGCMYAPATQEKTSEGMTASERPVSAIPATHSPTTPNAQRPMRQKPRRFMSQLVLRVSSAEMLQSAAEAAAALGWPDAPVSPPQLWGPRTRQGSVTIADDAAQPGAPGSHDTPASPSQLWRPRTRRGSVTSAGYAAPPSAAGCQDTLASPFQVQHQRSRRGSVTIAGDAAPQGAPGSHVTHLRPPSMMGYSLGMRGSVTLADDTAPPSSPGSYGFPARFLSLLRRSSGRRGSVTLAGDAAPLGAPGSYGSPASPPSLLQPSGSKQGSVTVADDAAPPGAPGNHNTLTSPSLLRRSRGRRGSVTIADDNAPQGVPGSHKTPAGPSLLRRSLSRRVFVTIPGEASPQDASTDHDTPASPPSMSGHTFSRRGSVTFSEEAASSPLASSPVFTSAALCGQQLGGLGSARSRRASALSIECGTHSSSSASRDVGAPLRLTHSASNRSAQTAGELDKTQIAPGLNRTHSSGSKQSSMHHEHNRGGERAVAAQDENHPSLSLHGRGPLRGGSDSQVMQTNSSSRLQQETGAVGEGSEVAPPSFAACVSPAQCDPPAVRRSPSVLGQQLQSMLASGAFASHQHNTRSVTAPQGRQENV